MKNWKRGWLSLVLVIALIGVAGLLTACGEDEETTTTEVGTENTTPGESTTTEAGEDLAADQTLTINVNTEPPSIDPNIGTDTTSALVMNNIFEGLVHLEIDGSASPGAAESWETSADGLTVTFNLRGTDTWTNGDPVTSEDFKNSWLRILDPATAGEYAYQLYFIAGAEEYNSGEGTADAVGIDATDPKVLKVTLKAPTPWFVQMMSHQAYFPIPKKVVDQFGEKWTEPANIVTNGPYKLTAWNHESDMVLEKWADWRDADAVTLETIKMVMIVEATTGVAAFENDEIDVQEDLPTADIDRLKALPEYKQFPMLGIYYYGMNVEAPPLDNVDVRKALALAVDRQSLIDNVVKGGQVPALGFIPEGMPGFDVIKKDFLKPTADIEQAKALLAAAGYPEGKGLPEITIYYNTSEGHQAIAEAIQAQWQAIGVNAKLQNMEWKQYLAFLPDDPAVQVYRMGWVADYGDAYNFFDVLRGGGGNNYTRWANPTYDEGLTTALTAATEEDRYAIYSDMENILSVEDMPVIPIYWYTNPELVKPWVTGYEPNALGGTTNLWWVKILNH